MFPVLQGLVELPYSRFLLCYFRTASLPSSGRCNALLILLCSECRSCISFRLSIANDILFNLHFSTRMLLVKLRTFCQASLCRRQRLCIVCVSRFLNLCYARLSQPLVGGITLDMRSLRSLGLGVAFAFLKFPLLYNDFGTSSHDPLAVARFPRRVNLTFAIL